MSKPDPKPEHPEHSVKPGKEAVPPAPQPDKVPSDPPPDIPPGGPF